MRTMLIALVVVVSLLCLVPASLAQGGGSSSNSSGGDSQSSSGPVAHIFLIAGQSNSIAYNTDGHTAEDKSFPNILQLSCCDGKGGYLPYNQCYLNVSSDPLHHYCDTTYLNSVSVGFGMSFARAMLPYVAYNDLIVLVPAGMSGTGFNPAPHTWPAYTGNGFTASVAKMKQVFSLFATSYPQYTPQWEGVLWHQGEYDAGDNAPARMPTNTSSYLNNDIEPLIAAFRDTKLMPFSYPELPFVAGQMLGSWALNVSHTERLGVYTAINTLDQLIPYTATTTSQGLLGDPRYLGLDSQVIHFSARSQRIFGRRYFAAWQLARYNVPDIAPSTATKYEIAEVSQSVSASANARAPLKYKVSQRRAVRK